MRLVQPTGSQAFNLHVETTALFQLHGACVSAFILEYGCVFVRDNAVVINARLFGTHIPDKGMPQSRC